MVKVASSVEAAREAASGFPVSVRGVLGVFLAVTLGCCGGACSSLAAVPWGGVAQNVVSQDVAGGRVSLNRMGVPYGLGRVPVGREVPRFGRDWYLNIPDSNDGLPAGYPRVEHKDLTVAQLQDLLSEQLQAALAVVYEETGVGPWQVTKVSGAGYGPSVTTPKGKEFQLGGSVHVLLKGDGDPSDEQYFQVLDVLDRFYPGIARPENQSRVFDTPEHRDYAMLSDDDDFFSVSRKDDAGHITVAFHSTSYITRDTVDFILEH